MIFKYNGIETDGSGNPELNIPAVVAGMVLLNAGDVIELANGVRFTVAIEGLYQLGYEDEV